MVMQNGVLVISWPGNWVNGLQACLLRGEQKLVLD
ncbi:Uncharacterised protein [Klebsiella pneumoniae]|nr:Uncharacterised protein [Klebsiella pneumoniae]